MAPTQLSIVLERMLNELGIADLSTFEAVLMHDTGAVLDAIRSTAAAAEAGAAVYASSATSNVVVSTGCLLYTSPSPRDRTRSRMPSSA